MQYYLSDHNMYQDHSFAKEILGYKNGWIPLTKLIWSRNHLGSLSNGDENVLLEALKKDTTGFLKLNENPPAICRSKRPKDSKNMDLRSIYCTGFPFNLIKSKDRKQLVTFFNQFPTLVNLKVILFLSVNKLITSFK